MLDDLATTPAVVLGWRMDVLACNPMAAALLTDFARAPEPRRNDVWLVFSDPAITRLHAGWEGVARVCVDQLCHPAAGELTLEWDALACVSDPASSNWSCGPPNPVLLSAVPQN